MPYDFIHREVSTMEEAIDLGRQNTTRGMALNNPEIQSKILDELDYVTNQCDAIGFADTILKDSFSDLHGENVEWRAIMTLAQNNSKEIGTLSSKNALVIGAGPSSLSAIFAFKKLYMKVYLLKESFTDETLLQEISNKFDINIVEDLSSLNDIKVVFNESDQDTQLNIDSFLDSVTIYFNPQNNIRSKLEGKKETTIIEKNELFIQKGIYQLEQFTKWISNNGLPLEVPTDKIFELFNQ